MIDLLLAGVLTWTAPEFLRSSCDQDPLNPAHDRQTNSVLKLNEVQPPFYRRGCEANPACWDSVRAFNEPVVVYSTIVLPGTRCSATVPAGLYVVIARNGIGPSCWSAMRRVP